MGINLVWFPLLFDVIVVSVLSIITKQKKSKNNFFIMREFLALELTLSVY